MTFGKQRIDKYYNLAKEKGYRARSSFKLLEINRKYNFLKDCHVVVDLCAAPGGWMQILAQEMPHPRKIIGIDLDPIKPIGGCLSFVGDITTEECEKKLTELLENHLVDAFVHDGSPNLGSSKEKDYFIQNDLVLSSLKLATQFLKEKGIFVSKVFRSENFSKIVKLAEELFQNVDVCKPLSSRTESAEIFLVCRNFKNINEINFDFNKLDSNFLFKDNEEIIDQYKKINLSDFLNIKNKEIVNYGQILIDINDTLINDEHRELFKDLKLLNNIDIKKIFTLKKKLNKKLNKNFIKDQISENDESSQLEDINLLIKKNNKNLQKNLKKNSQLKNINHFFDDKIFNNENFHKNLDPIENTQNIEVSSCSTSFDMTESEMRCALMLKENEDVFNENTIDRHLIDSDDIQLPHEKRPLKNELKINKKKIEIKNKKRTRAMRRANKVIKDIVLEDEKEEAVVYKKIYKSQLKKMRNKKRLIFPIKKGEKLRVPKGNGKLLFLDRRMKHDLRREKNKKK